MFTPAAKLKSLSLDDVCEHLMKQNTRYSSVSKNSGKEYFGKKGVCLSLKQLFELSRL